MLDTESGRMVLERGVPFQDCGGTEWHRSPPLERWGALAGTSQGGRSALHFGFSESQAQLQQSKIILAARVLAVPIVAVPACI